ncbi:hypothetical protein DY042_02455 [Apilactobacillus kunkeei]|nr:hypothetical protein [Apilactobacillus kunkeei]TPR52178.1 hypothetical protein DY042_02455 [Apilactobacillus kunkeei]
MLGFLCTGVTLPLLSVLAISVTRSKGVYDIGTPRTATVPFAVGIQPFLPSNFIRYGLIVFSFLFFLAAFLLSYKESSGINRNGLGTICNRWFTIWPNVSLVQK